MTFRWIQEIWVDGIRYGDDDKYKRSIYNVLFIILNILDLFTTRYALSNCTNLYELNVLYFNPYFDVIKLSMPFIVFGIYTFVCGITSYKVVKTVCVYSFLGLVLFSFCVVINNVLWIQR